MSSQTPVDQQPPAPNSSDHNGTQQPPPTHRDEDMGGAEYPSPENPFATATGVAQNGNQLPPPTHDEGMGGTEHPSPENPFATATGVAQNGNQLPPPTHDEDMGGTEHPSPENPFATATGVAQNGNQLPPPTHDEGMGGIDHPARVQSPAVKVEDDRAMDRFIDQMRGNTGVEPGRATTAALEFGPAPIIEIIDDGTSYDRIVLEQDPDRPEFGKLEAKILGMLKFRGFLFVIAPSLKSVNHQRGFLVKGSDYESERTRFQQKNMGYLMTGKKEHLKGYKWHDLTLIVSGVCEDNKYAYLVVSLPDKKGYYVFSKSVLDAKFSRAITDGLFYLQRYLVGQGPVPRQQRQQVIKLPDEIGIQYAANFYRGSGVVPPSGVGL
ncbi:hypothetical protein BKA67DRAFT_674707 [Truncatella angustata]|uniref:Uncharacterized protein n=1 Tax=Truncatella angustata TaxID=152316 RepID=A0A9P8UUI6_9PEZI|nr:uncharacterized protein BKA67DRAFT_674707 [Truncatella angustata]KAH6658619.1 hypothetical protein BKA67DRAFT_674707 [Truncatella angustata]